LAYLLRPDQLLFIDYGQNSARGELQAATQIAGDLGLPLKAVAIDCRAIGTGQMADGPALSDEAPEFWPYRNQLLITVAAMAFATEDALKIYVGTVSTDAVHPDGRSAFFDAMSALLLAQGNSDVEFPARGMTSTELLQRAGVPDEILAWAFSCHRASRACGQCRGCTKHFETMAAVNAARSPASA
jgi:7-cyano-7-deazaguanine synthase